MAMETYKHYYESYLEECIRTYDDVGCIVLLVNMYQGKDPVARHEDFREWTQAILFRCEFCHKNFTADVDEIEEDSHVLCKRCSKEYGE